MEGLSHNMASTPKHRKFHRMRNCDPSPQAMCFLEMLDAVSPAQEKALVMCPELCSADPQDIRNGLPPLHPTLGTPTKPLGVFPVNAFPAVRSAMFESPPRQQVGMAAFFTPTVSQEKRVPRLPTHTHPTASKSAMEANAIGELRSLVVALGLRVAQIDTALHDPCENSVFSTEANAGVAIKHSKNGQWNIAVRFPQTLCRIAEGVSDALALRRTIRIVIVAVLLVAVVTYRMSLRKSMALHW